MQRIFRSLTILAISSVAACVAVIAMMQVGGSNTDLIVDRVVHAIPVSAFPASLSNAIGINTSGRGVEGDWPPKCGQPFPDLILEDHNGKPTRLSEFAGRIILVEYAAIPCAGCQAFAGGKTYGSFGGFPVQALESIDHYAERFAGVKLGTDDVVFVQVLLYGKSLSAPSPAEVDGWAEHFAMDASPHRVVLRGDVSMLNQMTYDMIPGFHLIDRDFVLRSDSCGHQPVDNLYSDLLPLLGRLARD